MTQPSHEILDHHYRRIHDQPEVECAEAHEVGRVAESLHQEKSEEQRERDDGRRDQRRAQVAQEEEQDERDQHASLDEVAEHCARGAVHHLTLVVERLDGDALRHQRLDLPDALLHAPDDLLAIRPLQHHDHSRQCFAPPVA